MNEAQQKEGLVITRSLAERTEAMFRSVDPNGWLAQEWKEALQEPQEGVTAHGSLGAAVLACVETGLPQTLTPEAVRQLDADIAAARKKVRDAERYDWIRAHWDEVTGLAWRDPATGLDAHVEAMLAAHQEREDGKG